MSDRDGDAPVEKETVIVERGSGGGLLAGIALLIAGGRGTRLFRDAAYLIGAGPAPRPAGLLLPRR
jgi:hypothetical protein